MPGLPAAATFPLAAARLIAADCRLGRISRPGHPPTSRAVAVIQERQDPCSALMNPRGTKPAREPFRSLASEL